ncbi:MAG: helix-turn-helix domain-containing protein [Gemmataceae bacterium]
MADRCLTTREVAKRWRKRRAFVEGLVRSGALPAFRLDGAIRISPEAVTAFEQQAAVSTRPARPKRREYVEEFFK